MPGPVPCTLIVTFAHQTRQRYSSCQSIVRKCSYSSTIGQWSFQLDVVDIDSLSPLIFKFIRINLQQGIACFDNIPAIGSGTVFIHQCAPFTFTVIPSPASGIITSISSVAFFCKFN